MLRPWTLLAMLIVAAGCKGSGSQAPSTDPFFGRTRIEPPRTGAVSGNSFSSGAFPAQSSSAGPSGAGGLYGQNSGGSTGSTATPNPLGHTSAPSQSWLPVQPRENPLPASIPGNQRGGSNTSNSGIGSGGSSSFIPTTPNRPLSGTGDRISIPLAARSEPAWSNQTGPASSSSVTSAANSAASPTKADPNMPIGGEAPSGTGFSGMVSSPGPSPQPTRPYLDPGSPSSLEGKERIVREIERTASTPGVAQRYAPYPASGASSAANASGQATSGQGVNIADLPESK